MTWTNPDPWHCYQCGADGLGGRPAFDAHTDEHAPKPQPAPTRKPGSVVPTGLDSRDVRAYGVANGWKLGNRGRLPQALIDQYVAVQQPKQPRRVLDVEVIDELRALGESTEAIAHRLGVTVDAIAKAESRRRSA